MFNKIKPSIKTVFWIVCPIVIGVLLASFVLPASERMIGIILKNIDQKQTPETNLSAGLQGITMAQSGKSRYFYLNNASVAPKVSATAYLVGDLNTGEVILSKNQEKQLPIASISKLMTALVTSLIMAPDDVALVSKTALATKGTNGELKLGEK